MSDLYLKINSVKIHFDDCSQKKKTYFFQDEKEEDLKVAKKVEEAVVGENGIELIELSLEEKVEVRSRPISLQP